MSTSRVGAIVLAAGQSRRMGVNKMTLPWRGITVIGQVVTVLRQAGVDDIVVVTGGGSDLVEAALKDAPVRLVYNPDFKESDMLVSLQCGLGALDENIQAVLVALGDQPQIEVDVVRALIRSWRERQDLLVIPSFQMRRGHPWLVGRNLWDDLRKMDRTRTMRDFLTGQSENINYVNVNTSSIFKDLDTPQDYATEVQNNQ